MPVSSYPHVFPRRQSDAPDDFRSEIPADVLAGQC